MLSIHDDALLSTEELSAAFTKNLNLPLTPATLETMRSRGGGPPFEKFRKIVRYRWGVARDWRLAQGRALRSTSDSENRLPTQIEAI
jgi:hypothetical protein